MIFIDTETCGLHGLAVLIQWAEDARPIQLHNIWQETVGATKDLIFKIVNSSVCGFNLAFDWFHLAKIYTIWNLLDNDIIPEDAIEEIAILEPLARTGPCLKPKAAVDLMLHARKGPYQSLMNRKDIRIRRVPALLATKVAQYLENNIELNGIYFAKRKDRFAPKWQVFNIADEPDFKNIVLKFHPAGGLKNLAVHTGIADPKTLLQYGRDVGVALRPVEYGWAPFACAVGRPGRWQGAWPDVIQLHINYWAYNPLGRQYAKDDVTYTRDLYHYFGSPASGDDDSELACMVGAVRWHGFKIDIPKIKDLRAIAIKKSTLAPKDPGRVRDYILPHMSETEKLAMLTPRGEISTARPYLDVVKTWENQKTCIDCRGSGCGNCNETGLIATGGKHPAAIRAQAVLDARKAKKEVELYDKLLTAGRFHASFVVIGALSNRMAGCDGLNPQGINHQDIVRSSFPLADDGFTLCGGDFDAFEVKLADAVYGDITLRKELAAGLKIHALFAMEMYPDKSYEEILKSKGQDPDMYGRGKNGVFTIIYGGDENTLVHKYSIPLEIAQKAFTSFQTKHPGIKKKQVRIFNSFCSMRQPKGLGTNVEWHEPADYVESLFGFKRYFTLENQICKALYTLACDVPEEWKDYKIKIKRRQDKLQTPAGAVMSALYGAAFQIQAANMRAAANHEIQSSGAQITKKVQRDVWDVQPVGINPWVVIPMNVHDEVMVPTKPAYISHVENVVLRSVESFRDKVPLIKMIWKKGLVSWAGK